MGMIALGKVSVTTPGTPVRLTANRADPTARVACQTVLIQPLLGNTGSVYLGEQGMNKTTFAGVYAIVPTPAGGFSNFALSIPLAPAAFDAAALFLDADTAAEGVLVTVLVQ